MRKAWSTLVLASTSLSCEDPNNGRTNDGTSCSDQKAWGNCNADWMVGWCCKTCFGCADGCGGSGPNPPSPNPNPPSPGPAPGQDVFCPSANDLTVAYGKPDIQNQGWGINGGGAAATKSSFNLNGGYVEYDIDFSGVPTGVNANIYTISPKGLGSSGYNNDANYCDGADNDKPWCLEVDWIESNGNCGGATTLHTVQGPGSNGCTSWGCRQSYHYNGKTSFHMRIEYGQDGSWTTLRDGQNIGALSPSPSGSDWEVIKNFHESYGAVIYSSQWTGWVPVDDCGTNPGDLNSARFRVSNLKIAGSVVQGPIPTKCSSQQLTSNSNFAMKGGLKGN